MNVCIINVWGYTEILPAFLTFVNKVSALLRRATQEIKWLRPFFSEQRFASMFPKTGLNNVLRMSVTSLVYFWACARSTCAKWNSCIGDYFILDHLLNSYLWMPTKEKFYEYARNATHGKKCYAIQGSRKMFSWPSPRRGGTRGFQVTGMIEWSQKSRPKKIPGASSKTQKNPWTKN